jgi:transposase
MYRERNRIERMIGHLKINHAIATRYDKLARSFLDALHIAAIRRCLRGWFVGAGTATEPQEAG